MFDCCRQSIGYLHILLALFDTLVWLAMLTAAGELHSCYKLTIMAEACGHLKLQTAFPLRRSTGRLSRATDIQLLVQSIIFIVNKACCLLLPMPQTEL